jgi:hypothetical protein
MGKNLKTICTNKKNLSGDSLPLMEGTVGNTKSLIKRYCILWLMAYGIIVFSTETDGSQPTEFLKEISSVGNFSPARNQVGIGLSYRPASLCSLATQFQARLLESILRPVVGLMFSTQWFIWHALIDILKITWKGFS